MTNRHFLNAIIVSVSCGASLSAQTSEQARWEQRAQTITITRDDWGIAHVKGRTDADAVFGLMYAQAEDDFNRVETNFINAMGRLAEAEGESAVFQDLRMKLFIDPDSLKAMYAASPVWLKSLMDAWADGLNFYLHKNPQVKPRVITRFEPWMALSFSEGSIGGDIESVSIDSLRAFYGGEAGWLWDRVHGIGSAEIEVHGDAKSISRDETFPQDLRDDKDLERELLALVTRAAFDLRGDGMTARTITVRLRDMDFRTRSAQKTLPEAVVSDRVIMGVAKELLTKLRVARRVPARLIGVQLSSLAQDPKADQLPLFGPARGPLSETEKDRTLARAVDLVREKFGRKGIIPATLSQD